MNESESEKNKKINLLPYYSEIAQGQCYLSKQFAQFSQNFLPKEFQFKYNVEEDIKIFYYPIAKKTYYSRFNNCQSKSFKQCFLSRSLSRPNA